MPVIKMLLNIKKGIKIQPHQLSFTQSRPCFVMQWHIWKYLPQHQQTLVHTSRRWELVTRKHLAVESSEIQSCQFYNLLHTQLKFGTHRGVRVRQLLVHRLKQQRLWSWLCQDASLAGKKGRQKTCNSDYTTATSSCSVYFFQHSWLH